MPCQTFPISGKYCISRYSISEQYNFKFNNLIPTYQLALGTQLNALQVDISKCSKWDLKSRLQTYDKAFGLLPAMHTSCSSAIEEKDGEIQRLLEENIVLNEKVKRSFENWRDNLHYSFLLLNLIQYTY